ncbi:MAG: DnaA N-terminal domain-containing protein [Sulfurimonas sp.]
MNIGQTILEELKNEITEVEYNRYIKHLEYDLKKSSSDMAIFYAPNALVVSWKNYTKKFKRKKKSKSN